MFGGAEMVRGDAGPEAKQDIKAILDAFSSSVNARLPKHGLARGQVPFVRPVNFVAVLAPNGLLLVVDNVPVGGIPDHLYLDRRAAGTPIPLDAALSLSVREFGYRQPMGVTLPSPTGDGSTEAIRPTLDTIAEQVCGQLAELAKVENINIPPAFQHLRQFLPEFLRDHPNPEKNVFLMMRYQETELFEFIENTIRERLKQFGLTVLRADDKDYTGDLWENVALYMIGCGFGVAVFEEIDEREFNPSVALELGFMMANGKRCLLLKDKRMPKMPTDIVGKLYKPFDTYNIEQTVGEALDAWVRDIGLTK